MEKNHHWWSGRKEIFAYAKGCKEIPKAAK
jgi:hypothetical protein